jgi:lipoprotein NlpD
VVIRSLISRLSLVLCAVALQLGGCGPSWSPEDIRPAGSGAYQPTADGYYRVRRGDSLHTIAFKLGMDWRNLAEWNGIRAPYIIHPDQELRLSPPPSRGSDAVVTRPARTPATAVSSEQPRPTAGTSSTPAPPAAATAPAVQAEVSVPPGQAEASVPAGRPAGEPAPRPGAPSAPTTDPAAWLWPSEGRLLSTFRANDPARNGIEIGGSEGQPVLAAARGEVVYSGSGLIGYGELIIVKHSDRMLSAYAHNRRRLVAEGQQVAAGEQVAEMGRDERNRALLHFEIRVNGTPQDPLKYLPRR